MEGERNMQGHNSSLREIVDDPPTQSDKHPNVFLIKCQPISAHAKAFVLVHTNTHMDIHMCVHTHTHTRTHTHNSFRSLFTHLYSMIRMLTMHPQLSTIYTHTHYSELFRHPVKYVWRCTEYSFVGHSTWFTQMCVVLKCHFLLTT